MIIILEGHDGSGKSTLANQLARQTGYPVLHRTQPKDEAEKIAMMKSYVDIIATGKNYIFDRCWYSEMVYGPIMRDASCITYPEMYELERLLTKKGAIIMYCYDTPAKLWNRAQARGEDYITDRATFNKIADAYEELFRVPHLIPVAGYRISD